MRLASSSSSALLPSYGSPVITSARSVMAHPQRTITHPAPEAVGSNADAPPRPTRPLPTKMLNSALLVVLDLRPTMRNTLMLLAHRTRLVTPAPLPAELTPVRSTRTLTHRHTRPFQPMAGTTLVPLAPVSTHTGMTTPSNQPPITSRSLNRKPFLYNFLN